MTDYHRDWLFWNKSHSKKNTISSVMKARFEEIFDIVDEYFASEYKRNKNCRRAYIKRNWRGKYLICHFAMGYCVQRDIFIENTDNYFIDLPLSLCELSKEQIIEWLQGWDFWFLS